MKLAKYGLATVLTLGTFIGTGVAALAADGGNLETDAIVNFTPSEEITGPVDPTDPENPIDPIDPIDPEKPIEPGTAGPLSIDFASKLNFGENKISSKDEVYNVMAQPVRDESAPGGVRYVPNYVQVTDNRGTLDGWTLSVKQNGQFTSESKAELTGAVISFKNGDLGSVSDSNRPSTVEASFDLDATGSSQDVIIASTDEGAGTWAYLFGTADSLIQGEEYVENESITLTVPGSSVKLAESYTTSLTWTLSDVPGNDVEEPGIPNAQ